MSASSDIIEPNIDNKEKKKDYFDRLDSLRFLAFFLVFLNHITSFLHFPPGVNNYTTLSFAYLQMGDLGVGFFFVLSGFLITYLLEKEKNKNGKISLRNFYVRRVLRIWPLYFLAIVTIIMISLSFQNFDLFKTKVDPKEILYHIFFLGNFFRAFQHTTNEMVAVLWSIAVEEQFYLIWPIVLIIFRKYIAVVLLIGIIISMAFRYHFANNFEVREFFTYCVMIYLLVGAFIGIYGPRLKGYFEGRGTVIGLSSFAGVVALLSVRGLVFKASYPPIFIALDGLGFALLFGLIILSAVYGKKAHSTDKTQKKNFIIRTTEYLGTISYGLYVYHLIALTLLIEILGKFGFDYHTLTAPKFFFLAISALALVVLIASVSYRFYEKPFLKLKERFMK